MPYCTSWSGNSPGDTPAAYQLYATASIPRRTRRSRATMSITCGWPPWLLNSTSFLTPARATASPSSVQSRISVSAESVSVPGNATCSLLLPTGIAGRTVTGTRSGSSSSARATTPWLMQASTHSGR